MEKNVPLLKLIHDPWSIKTMLSSRFFFHVSPSASSCSLQQQYIQPPLGNQKWDNHEIGDGEGG